MEIILIILVGLVHIFFIKWFIQFIRWFIGSFIKWIKQFNGQRKQQYKELSPILNEFAQTKQELYYLNKFIDKEEYEEYELASYRLLSRLETHLIDIKTIGLLSYESLTLSKEIKEQIQLIKDNLQRYGQKATHAQKKASSTDATRLSNDKVEYVHSIAPELFITYRNIQTDSTLILEKIKEAENRTELEALHNIHMKRCEEILYGYILIKQSPKDYQNAEERLRRAKEALEHFDLELDEVLRQINENGLADFEVSLRMMEEKYVAEATDEFKK